MNRSVWLRALISLWGIWFATALTEPAGLMSCPMHSGMAGMVATGATGGATHAGSHTSRAATDELAAHEHHAATPTDDTAPAPHHSCTCLGQCCALALDALVERAETVLPAGASRVIRVALPSVVTHIATPVQYSRPFANGPPSVIA